MISLKKKYLNFKKNKNITIAPLIVLSFLSVAGVMTTLDMTLPQEKLASVSSLEFAKEVAGNDDIVLVDVRTPKEFYQGHLSGAVNIDHGSSDLEQTISELDTDSFYALYCRSGRRSKEVFRIMEDKGFSRVIDLKGGIEALRRNEEALKHLNTSE
ncbi:MAG: rhodanese-like domain-containing protein [Patescibacteria group bacterium]